MAADKILTLHPDPNKRGVNIDPSKYRLMRETIESVLAAAGELSFVELLLAVETQLLPVFEGSVGWYFTTVKLDLEARGVIERVPGAKPQRLRLKTEPRE